MSSKDTRDLTLFSWLSSIYTVKNELKTIKKEKVNIRPKHVEKVMENGDDERDNTVTSVVIASMPIGN